MQCHPFLCTDVFGKSNLALTWDKCGVVAGSKAPRGGHVSQPCRLEPGALLGGPRWGDFAARVPRAEAGTFPISGGHMCEGKLG